MPPIGEHTLEDGTTKSLLPPQSVLQAVLWPAAQVGLFTGSSGLVTGGVLGVLRSSSAPLTATAFGIHWFMLGSIFWGSRASLLRSTSLERFHPREKLYASGLAAGLAGGALGLISRGRRHVIPGATTHSIVGLVGQATYSHVKADTIDSGGAKPQHKNPIWVRLLSSKWSPTKVLTDEEYEAILQEKLLRINADIAIVDENIRNLVKEQSKQK